MPERVLSRKEPKTCPRPACGSLAVGRAEIEAVFGFRRLNGRVIPQSWCRPCRGGGTMSLVDDRPAAGDRWRTPREVFDFYHARYGFTVDAAADARNRLLPRHFPDGLRAPWAGERVWCNPPYSYIDPWVEKAAEADVACLLLPARTDRPWFNLIWDRQEQRPAEGWRVEFPEGRVRFEGAAGDPNWSSMVCVWGSV